jgi:hypothetical protein
MFLPPDVVYHRVIARSKKVRLGLAAFHLLMVAPHFLKRILDNVARLIFIPYVFQDKAEQPVSIIIHTFVKLSRSHFLKQTMLILLM